MGAFKQQSLSKGWNLHYMGTAHCGYWGIMEDMSVIEDTRVLLETDQRGRLTLPGVARRRFLARTETDGTIILEPAMVMTEAERKFLANTELQATIAHYDSHPEQLVPRRRRRLNA